MLSEIYTSTTNEIVGKKPIQHIGLVDETIIFGTFFVKDIFASLSDFFGGRSKSYEQTVEESRALALEEITTKAQAMGANAIVGIHFDTETVRGTMLMVSARGTAIIVE